MKGRVGERQLCEGVSAPLRFGGNADWVTQRLWGTWFETAFRCTFWFAGDSNSVPGTITDATSTTTAFGLWNPPGSNVIASLVKWQASMFSLPVSPVEGIYGLYVTQDPLNDISGNQESIPLPAIASRPVNLSASFKKKMRNVGLVAMGTDQRPCVKVLRAMVNNSGNAGSLFRVMGTKLTGDATTMPAIMPPFEIDFDGTCLLMPGCTIGIKQIGADGTNASLANCVTWQEIPMT